MLDNYLVFGASQECRGWGGGWMGVVSGWGEGRGGSDKPCCIYNVLQ